MRALLVPPLLLLSALGASSPGLRDTVGPRSPRLGDSISSVCGLDPVDCGGGWCCQVGQVCRPPADDGVPQCQDLFLFNGDGSPVTISAAPFSTAAARSTLSERAQPASTASPSALIVDVPTISYDAATRLSQQTFAATPPTGAAPGAAATASNGAPAAMDGSGSDGGSARAIVAALVGIKIALL